MIATRSGVKDMTRGNPYTLMIGFALPILLSQVFQQLYNTADTLIVGRFLGTTALAAVSSSGTLIFLLSAFFIGTAQGAGVVISRYFGAGDHEKVSLAIHTNVAFGLAAGGFLTVVGVLLTPYMLRWMNTDPAVLPEAIEYFRYYFIGSFAMVMYNTLRSVMNSLGDSRRPLLYLIVSSVLNIGLDLLFVGLFRWGVWSAAVATVISQAFSAVLCLVHLCRKNQIYTISFRKIRFDGPILREILRYGIPGGVQNSVIGFANVIVQSQINLFGQYATAAYGSYAKIEGFAFLPINSFTMAITTFVSQNLGAGAKARARTGARFGIVLSVVLAELIGVGFYLSAPYLIGLFDSTAEVLSFGVTHAHICSLFYGLLAFSHAIAAVCRGAGKAFVPMAVMLSVWCVFRVIYIILVMHFIHTINMVYWAYPITWGISSTVFLFYYLFSKWQDGFDAKASLVPVEPPEEPLPDVMSSDDEAIGA